MQTILKLQLYESTLELCEAIMNWTISNRKALRRSEFEDYRKRVMVIPRSIGSALDESKIEECFGKLIIVNKELNSLLIEIKSRYRTIGRLELNIEECFTKYTKFLNDYHYC